MHKPISVVLAAAAFALCAGGSASANVLLFDDFAEAPAQQNNFAALTNFDVVEGTVDAFQNGGFGLPCASLGCLDLDGSSGNAGRLESKTSFAIQTGVEYTLSLLVEGNQRFTASDTMTFGMIDGGGVLFSDLVVLGRDDPLQTVAVSFTALGDTLAKIFIDHAGGDNVGILLDSVELSDDVGVDGVVPLPAAMPLLLTGLAVLGFAARRRR